MSRRDLTALALVPRQQKSTSPDDAADKKKFLDVKRKMSSKSRSSFFGASMDRIVEPNSALLSDKYHKLPEKKTSYKNKNVFSHARYESNKLGSAPNSQR